ncbi:hypothetical protein SLA2020_133120 [Shorea laevis]
MWRPLVESVRKKLLGWKGRYLSFGGRITLINSVLSSLPVFLMSVFLIPKGTLTSIDKMRRSFLWGGEGEGKKINWVKWEKVCKDKECGGLGVRDLRSFNLALMGKWWGRLATCEGGLWKKVIVAKYSEGRSHWMDWVRNGLRAGSLWWKDIRGINNVEGGNARWLSEGFNLKIGEGKGVSFWWDEWCGNGCLANRFPRLYLLSAGKDRDCYQMGNLHNGSWRWNLTWRRNLLEREEQAIMELRRTIEDVKISPGCPDKWEWTHTKDGHYSTSSAYSILTTEQRNPNEAHLFKRVWNPIIPRKISAFNWQLLLDKIPTKSNLIKRGFDQNMEGGVCDICEEELEDANHLFLRCRITKWLWNECATWWGINIRIENDCWKTFNQFGTWTRNTRIRKGWDCIWSALVWSVWLTRNRKIFHNQEVNTSKLLELIQLKSFAWIKARIARSYFNLSDWLLNPIACLTMNCGGRR